VGVFSAPTSVYAIEILNRGHLPTSDFLSAQKYWRSAIRFEANYPLPSMLISEFLLITGISKEFAIFLPIVGLACIIYFILAKKILCERKNSQYELFFSSLFYAFVALNNLHANYVGRATLGSILFAFFLYSYLTHLDYYLKRSSRLSWFILSFLFALASGYTYYTSTFGIMILTTSMWLLLLILFSTAQRRFVVPELTIAVTTAFLLIRNPLLETVASGFSLTLFVNNLITYAKAMLRLETKQNPAWLLFYGYVHMDPLTQQLHQIVFFIKLISIISVIVAHLIYRPKINLRIVYKNTIKSNVKLESWASIRRIWLFSLLVLLYSISGIGYLSVGALFPLGGMIKYGLIFLFFMVNDLFQNYSTNNLTKSKNSVWKVFSHILGLPKNMALNRQNTLPRILVIFVALTVLMGCWGAIREGWLYGSAAAKPFGYYKVHSVSDFLTAHASNETYITVTGDAYYTSIIFFKAFLNGQAHNVKPEPITKDAITLYESLTTGNMNSFFANMTKRNIHYFLTVDMSEPLWGDGWGYAVMLTNFNTISQQSDLVYDGYLQLYQFR